MATQKQGATRLRRAAKKLTALADKVSRGTTARDDLDLVVAEIVGAQRDIYGPRPRAKHGEGGKHKILAYLLDHVGQEVHGEELSVVSGIHEWARRVRELRVEDGWEIAELGASTYRLDSAKPNAERAQQWQVANEIRNSGGSATDRIGRFFEANVGAVVTREQIDYVSGIKEGSRRARELRDEQGWPIASNIDEKALKPGEYRLLSADPKDRRDPLQRLWPENLREKVFRRDNYTCQICHRNHEIAEAAGDRRFYLEAHHVVAVADELAGLPKSKRNDIDNLITLCHSDHLKETAKLQRQKAKQRRGN